MVGTDWWEGGTCPLCGQSADDEGLESRIQQHLDSATDTRRRCDDLEKLRSEGRRELELIRNATRNLRTAIADVPECEPLRSVAEELVQTCEGVRSVLSKPLKHGEEVTGDELAELPDVKRRFDSGSKDVLDALASRLTVLSPSAQERARLDAFRRLSAVENDLRQLDALDNQRRVIVQQVESMHAVVEAFERHERQTTTDVLDRISDNVSAYYTKLHGGERYDNIRLQFLPEDRGLEFRLDAHGETISPPRLLLSESHMNSLGLCLFLAAAREFNSATRFLVLDDIVNSFDADHRAQLAGLLIDAFDDFQVIALTHDPIWFDILRRMGPGWRVHRITGWTYELGIEIAGDAQEERARIEDYLDRGKEEVAGNLTRQFVERRLKRLCRELRVAVPYREGYDNERRTGYELFRALRRHAKASGRFGAVDHLVWSQFDASNFLANLQSAYTVIIKVRQHFGNDPNTFSRFPFPVTIDDVASEGVMSGAGSAPFVGASKVFWFDCPGVDRNSTSVLMFQSLGVQHEGNILQINQVTAPQPSVFGGVPVIPALSGVLPTWTANVMLVGPFVLGDRQHAAHRISACPERRDFRAGRLRHR